MNASLSELTLLFLKLGTIGFGGPAAHIALMQNEIVQKRKWLTDQEFLDLYSATNFIPGPNSTEMAIHIGYRFAGWRGLFMCGLAFILPAFFIVGGFAWAYVTYGSMPEVRSILYGIKPIIIAVVGQAIWKLAHSAINTKFLAAVGFIAFILNFSGVNELIVLAAAGAASSIYFQKLNGRSRLGAWLPLSTGTTIFASTAISQITLPHIFLIFLKIGSVLFGSGYVLVAFLRSDLVVKLNLLTEAQLLDAIAVGQVTPGPVFTTATFIGYLLSGPLGALVATVGIFLPAFIFVAMSAQFIHRLRGSSHMASILDGVNAASLAIMCVATVWLGRSSIVDFRSLMVTILAALLLIRYKVNSVWLIGIGGILGFLIPQ